MVAPRKAGGSFPAIFGQAEVPREKNSGFLAQILWPLFFWRPLGPPSLFKTLFSTPDPTVCGGSRPDPTGL